MDKSIEQNLSFFNKHQRLYLWGLAGVGKTTLGKKLARILNIPFIDLDSKIEEESNLTVEQIFSQFGEDYFRKLERQTLEMVSTQKALIATGGGTPCFYDNASYMLQKGTCIYLEATAKFSASRLFNAKKVRPLIAKANTLEEVEEIIARQLLAREEFYQLATIKVDAIGANADRILIALKES